MEGRLYEPHDFINRATKELYRGQMHNCMAFLESCIHEYGNKAETLKRFEVRAKAYGCKFSEVESVVKEIENELQ